jgi:hypothetical protein
LHFVFQSITSVGVSEEKQLAVITFPSLEWKDGVFKLGMKEGRIWWVRKGGR